jgi:hypothetical protein
MISYRPQCYSEYSGFGCVCAGEGFSARCRVCEADGRVGGEGSGLEQVHPVGGAGKYVEKKAGAESARFFGA